MESNQCDQGGDSGGDDQDALKQVINIRSYECNFCKRGFSNAQALGGHMNIHRKDKAKLKQQSNLEQGNSSEELNKLLLLPNLNSNIVSQKQDHQQRVPSRSEENILVIDHSKQLQLPLFSQSPMKNEMQNPQGDQIQREITTTITTTQEPLLLSSDDQDSSSELDLELRLGSEPHDSSKPTGTRKFF